MNGDYPDESLQLYFKKYKTYKLSNTLPDDEDSYFLDLETDAYEYRYAALSSEISGDNTFVLWIDALGIEWLPLLKWSLETSCKGILASVKVAQASAPIGERF